MNNLAFHHNLESAAVLNVKNWPFAVIFHFVRTILYIQNLQYELKIYLQKILKFLKQDTPMIDSVNHILIFKLPFLVQYFVHKCQKFNKYFGASETCIWSVYVKAAILNWKVKSKGHRRTLGSGVA